MYKYNVYYEGTWLHEDTGWETQEDAKDDAEIYIEEFMFHPKQPAPRISAHWHTGSIARAPQSSVLHL